MLERILVLAGMPTDRENERLNRFEPQTEAQPTQIGHKKRELLWRNSLIFGDPPGILQLELPR